MQKQNVKYYPQCETKNLIIWRIIICIRYSKLFEVYHKKNEVVSDNLSIEIYVNQIENRIKFKIKIRCYLELLTAEMMKLLENGKSKITKDKNGENIGKNINKKLIDKYSQKLLDQAKKSATDALKLLQKEQLKENRSNWEIDK